MEQTALAVLGWLAVNVCALVVGELVAGVTGAVDGDEDLRPVALVWFAFLGFAAGALTCLTFPDRMLPAPRVPGISLVVVPALFSAAMALTGRLLSSPSHLASWYGGAAFGLGSAAGRLIGLAFVAEIRSI